MPNDNAGTVQNRLLQAAISAAQRGWRVFPVLVGSKRPAIKNWEARATTDLQRIERCWSSGEYNIGLACGPSGLVVIDLDVPKPGELAPARWASSGVTDGVGVLEVLAGHAGSAGSIQTFTVVTPRSGQHRYYLPPAGARLANTQRSIGWLIDTRGHGGYVLAAGSIVDGKPYTISADIEVAQLPACLAELLESQQARTISPPRTNYAAALSTNTRRERYLAAALRNETRAVVDAPTGTRNQRLYIAALRLGELTSTGELDRLTVVTALVEAGTANGRGGERECHNTIQSGLKVGEQNPRKVPA